jgi:hypothetical protein
MIFMVDEFIARNIEDLAMHSYFFSPAVLCLSHAYGIEAPPAAHGKPFIFGEPVVILRVDYREFSLGEGNPAEGIAVAEFTVAKEQPDAQAEDELRQIDFDVNRSQKTTKSAIDNRENF